MSSILYGAMSRNRKESVPSAPVSVQVTRSAGPGAPAQTTTSPASRWVDAAAALVPAEVLAIHALVISYGTKTKGEGEKAVTTFTHADGVAWSFAGMLVLAMVFYLAGAKTFDWQWDFARILVPPAALLG